MSYLVLARKWRPQTFDEVVGQPHVTRTLQNAIRSGRVAHAYLFTGARGVGKTSVARILAKALNCQKGISPDPCNVCTNCKEITKGRSVDVLEIDGASNRGIDSIRELRETIRFRPVKSHYKIYIIDEVHMLTTEAFNALLKTLEEPPEHVRFIFATTEPHKIPATILSRCQRFDFRRIPTGLILEHLNRIAENEGARFSPSVLLAVAQEADGSMRDAQSLMEQILAFRDDHLGDEELLELLGVVDRRSLVRAVKAVMDGDVSACLLVVEELYRRGIDSKRFCQQLCEYFRNMLLFSLSPERASEMMVMPDEEKGFIEEASQKLGTENLFFYFQMALRGEEEIRRSSLPRLTLEMLLLRMSHVPHLESLQDLVHKIDDLRNRLDSDQDPSPAPGYPKDEGPRFTPSASEKERQAASANREGESRKGTPPPPHRPPESTMDFTSPMELRDVPMVWPSFCRKIHAEDPVLGAKLSKSQARIDERGHLVVQIQEIYKASFQDHQPKADLTRKIEDHFGLSHVKIHIESQGATGKGSGHSRQGPSRRAVSKRKALAHPAVQRTIETLGGEIVEIRPAKDHDKAT